MAQFGPVLTAMVTPFTANGDVDLDQAQALANKLISEGNNGVVLAGTTGESATLSHGEQIDLIKAVVEATEGAAVIAGAGSNNTAAAVELTQLASAAGADGILSVAPYYNRPSQAGIEQHFRAVAAATDLPVVLYDIPGRTGRKVETETLLRLAEVNNITALKDAAGQPQETAWLISQVGDGFEVYSGDDALTLPLLSVGAVGVIGVATHWIGEEMTEMITTYSKGEVKRAAELNQVMLPSFNFESSDEAPNPIPTKALLNLLGQPVGECRPPMATPPLSKVTDQARAVLAGLGRDVPNA